MLLILALPWLVRADSLVVAGHIQPLATPLIMEGDEILAPLVPSLRLLGVKAVQQGATVTLTSPGGTTLQLTVDATTALVDGKRITIPVAPRDVAGLRYLPVRALAPYLGAAVRFQGEIGTLALSPYLTVSGQQRPDGGITVLARSTASVQYTSRTLSDPPRAYIDFKNVALGNAEPEIVINAGGVQRLRLAQFSTQPDVVRVVVDLDNPRTVNATISEAGRQVALAIGGDPAPEKTTEPVWGAPQPEGPRLFDLALDAVSAKQSQLTIGAVGSVDVSSEYRAKERALTLTVPGAMSTIPDDHVADITDKHIRSVAVRELQPTGVEITVTFTRDLGYLINRDATGIRLLVGTFSLNDMTIVLDAGHGGHDSGAIGGQGTCEKNVNLDIVLRTEKLLRAAGVEVVLSRGDDTFIPLPERSGLANRSGVDLFVSVHCNSTPKRNSQQGTQVYYRTPQSIRLAEAMLTEMVEGTRLKNGGVRNGNFHVIRETTMPSVLIETAFINNDREEKLLCSPEFCQKVAQSIVNGLKRYAATATWQQQRNPQPRTLSLPVPAESESGK